MSRRSRLTLPIAIAATIIAVATGGPVQARTAQHPFAEQAAAAHLTAMQSVELQSEVERYREATGGKQVSPNKIDLADGAELLVAVPGEAYPRDFTSSNGARAAADHCDTQYSGWFCAYSKSGYQGTVLQWYRCDTYTVPFGSGGSWINDQTKGQIARMYSPAGNLIFTTYAYDSDVSGNWLPVHTVKLC